MVLNDCKTQGGTKNIREYLNLNIKYKLIVL